jgi:biopolymer transport protein ExbD
MAPSRTGRRRERKGAGAAALLFDRETEFEFQIAPMADLLFVLLVFFMSITSLDSLRLEKRISLPSPPDAAAADARPEAARHRAVIALGWLPDAHAGPISADGKPLSGPEPLLSWIQERRRADPALTVTIEADRAVPYARVAQVMRFCAAAHIDTVTFAVAAPGKEEKP